MIKYKVSTPKAHRKYITFEAEFPANQNKVKLQLPAWRPGRYELGNFAQYIYDISFSDLNGNPISAKKSSKDLWIVDCGSLERFIVKYQFYADVLNAGSSYIHEDFLYVNPINCFFYLPEQADLTYQIELDLDFNFTLATGLPHENGVMLARDYQQVMDCPFIASKEIEKWSYTAGDCLFNIWIQGNHSFDKKEQTAIFKAFTQKQIEAFGSIPCEEYHFLFIFPDFPVRHGVEHENSTVITIGPSEILKKPEWKDEFLGISSHELYHTWNIKKIRPQEMLPYDFSKENYSELGYVAEGVTTYMGEQYLWRSGYYDDRKFFGRYGQTIKKHGHNYGRFNLSVAESSFDTWLDGYKIGTPWRKVSIYVEGSICALICDLEIISTSKGKYSLDDVMRALYNDALAGKGYTAEDYRKYAEQFAGKDLSPLFEDRLYGTSDYFPLLRENLTKVGIELSTQAAQSKWEHKAGIKFSGLKIIDVALDSPADVAGLRLGDEIVSLNGKVPSKEIDLMFDGDHMSIEYSRDGRKHPCTIELNDQEYFPNYHLKRKEKCSDEELGLFDFWKFRKA